MDDIEALKDEVYGVFVQTNVANATIESVDESQALVWFILLVLLIVFLTSLSTSSKNTL